MRRHPNGGTAGAVDGNTFRAELAAALRDAPDPEAAHVVTTRLLATRLGVDRAFYALLERDALVVLQEHHGDAPSVAGRHRAEDVGLGLLAEVREGRTVVVTDVTTDARVDANGRARAEEAGVGALIAVPLPATDGLDGVLVAHSSTPRDWTDDEVALVTGAAAQVPLAVERVRAQQALRESEARFGALFSAIDEGFCVCEMIVDEDGTPRDYRFLDMNPRFEALTGLSGARGRTALELVPDLERRWIETYAAVAFSGRPARFQDTSEALGRTFDVFATPVEPRGRFALVFTDITARTRADAVLRDAAARDRFRALLTDTLRTLTDPFEVQRASVRLLGEHMGVDRAFFAEADGDVVTIHHDHTSGVPSAAGTYRLPDFGRAAADAVSAGVTLAVDDVAAEPGLLDEERAAYTAIGVRAHLTASLVRDGRLLALLGVHRTEPHAWSEDEVDLLEEVAERVWSAVERVRAEAALRAGEERFRTVVEVSPQFVWVIAPDGTLEFVNRRWTEYSGLDLAGTADVGLLADTVHPDEREEVFRRWRASVAAGEAFEMEARLRGRDGGYRWFLVRTVPLRDADGAIRNWFGVSTDIHERHRAEEALRAEEERERRIHQRIEVLAGIGQALDEELGVERRLMRLAARVVPALADLCAVDLAEDGGVRRVATVRTGHGGSDLGAEHADAVRHVLAGGGPRLLTGGAGSPLHQAAVVPMQVRGEPFGAVTLGMTRDSGRTLGADDLALAVQVGERAGLAVDNARLFEREERARRRADEMRRRVEALQRLTAELSRATTRAEVAEAGVRAGLDTTGGSRAWLLEDAGDPAGLVMVHTQGVPADLERSHRVLAREGADPLAEVTMTGRPLFLTTAGEIHARYPGFAAMDPAAQAVAVVPVRGGGARPAALGLSFAEPRPFPDADREQLIAVGRLVGQAFARAERYETERELSRVLQRRLLPTSLPVVAGMAIATHYSPGTTGTEAGGDWYDAFTIPDGRLAITVGDVVGRGPNAAAVMGQLRSVLKAYLHEGRSPAEALGALNAFSRLVTDALASTAVCMVVTPATGEVVWSRAGHPPPLRTGPGGTALLPEVHGPLLGASADVLHDEDRLVLAPGESLLAFSDGLFERRGESLDDGLARLAAHVDEHPPVAPAIVAAAHRLSRTSDDDVVAVAVTRLLPDLRMTVPARAPELGGVRAALREWLAPMRLPRQTVDDMVLAVGEATANAVDHAYSGAEPGAMHVHAAQTTHGDVRLEVRDEGHWRPARAPVDVTRGRGLPIIRTVCGDVDIRHGGDGTAVVMTFPLPTAPAVARGDETPARGPFALLRQPERAALVVTGDLDRDGASGLTDAAAAMLRTAPSVTVDLRGATYVGSEGVACLVRLAAAAGRVGARLRVLVAPDGPADRALALTGLTGELDVVSVAGV